jgi:hypothetical protein
LDLLTLSELSQCINKGVELFTCQCGTPFSCPEHDIIGISRPQNGLVDMGAYETILECIWDHWSGGNDLLLLVYPNPSTNKITFSLTELTANTQLSIFNIRGENVLEMQINNIEMQIDISALQQGVYFVRMQDEERVEVVKMIKN